MSEPPFPRHGNDKIKTKQIGFLSSISKPIITTINTYDRRKKKKTVGV